ncbi:hypothetical protein MM236_07855 [Belliella sp. DSM 107340]|uniref:Long-chain fatty acid transport protein n=1 Tax=Belliella calami TaxID=2923436 RepID=A0ABS9UNQ8_9BACT|nr:hypothetical protein [Belliella calami]MCH7397898.1 hypothetical protein [Belliella calami]
MSIKNRLRFIGAIGAFFILSESFSQSSASTYSALGLGEFNFNGLTHNQAMGGLGISYGTGWAVNNVNPALSTRNTVFNFQAAMNYRSVNAATSSQSESLDGGGLSYLALSLPFKPGKVTFGMGLNQISSVNYSILASGEVANTDLTSFNRVEGDGGITEAYLSTGILLAKNLSIGLHGSYLFGSTIRTNQLSLIDTTGNSQGVTSEYYERFSVADVAVKGGIHYFFKAGARSNIHLGAMYHKFGNINGKQFAKVADFGDASNPDRPGDIINDNDRGNIFLPDRHGYGVTFEKINKFVVGLEAQFQDFSKYRSFTGETGDLGDSFKLALGGQITPDISSQDNMFKRSTYRMGLEYQQTPYIVNQTQVTDLGINFGGSIPVNSLSMVNVAIKVGTRGSTNNGLIRENYVNFSLGFSLNDNSWFYKRSFE